MPTHWNLLGSYKQNKTKHVDFPALPQKFRLLVTGLGSHWSLGWCLGRREGGGVRVCRCSEASGLGLSGARGGETQLQTRSSCAPENRSVIVEEKESNVATMLSQISIKARREDHQAARNRAAESEGNCRHATLRVDLPSGVR